ncbi:MAG TPA: glucose-6-phosphate isomerase [Burkholderiaceae bacterium]|jgi:glucose-6-phosphate isomerase, archaeal|nr:glucose-6-phosphate isomerase [Burkholderiaceae bacterium]
MTIREPVGCTVNVPEGVMAGATGRYTKTFGELEALYADRQAFAAMAPSMRDSVVYEVTEFRPSSATGDLIFGVTRMAPGKVGGEFFMTRGHLHAKADRPEIYYGQSGRGVMLMESPDGETRTVVIEPQTVCYVPPFWIHRSVNVGDDDLVMMFCYPADAGQDYEIIARSGGMRLRIVDDGSRGWTTIGNTNYRPRTQQECERLLEPTR